MIAIIITYINAGLYFRLLYVSNEVFYLLVPEDCGQWKKFSDCDFILLVLPGKKICRWLCLCPSFCVIGDNTGL